MILSPGKLLLFVVCSALALGEEDQVAYGKYLAEEVGKCQECHTPKLENGEFDSTKHMKGAVLDFAPLKPTPKWHKTSPDITPAGRLWSKWGEANLRKYLQTGLTPANKPADPPMPAYRMTAKDADAIVEYLKTIK